jgi:hypothetical protein
MDVQYSRIVLHGATIALGLFGGVLVSLELGRRFGMRRLARHGADARVGVGVVDRAVYGLFALLTGFTFSGAANRFDARRAILAQQIDAIRTAWIRIDALPVDARPAVRDATRQYVDALIASYEEPASIEDAIREPPAVAAAAQQLWTRALAACLAPGGDAARPLLLPAVSAVFSTVESERLARVFHPPPLVFALLGLTALAASLFAGYAMASAAPRNWLHMIGVAATIAVAWYAIAQLEFPRLGRVKVGDLDRALTELRATMR